MADSLLVQLEEDIQEDIRGLALTGLTSANVVILPVPMDDKYKLVPSLPAVIICPFGPEVIKTATNASDSITYPILVAILVQSSVIEEAVDPIAEQDKYLLWRENIIDNQVHNRTRTNAPASLVDKKLQLNPLVNLQAYLQQDLFISSFLIQCECIVTRRT